MYAANCFRNTMWNAECFLVFSSPSGDFSLSLVVCLCGPMWSMSHPVIVDDSLKSGYCLYIILP